ncbi:MAG: hypothetical protein A3D28_06415 [Omnitrophica bacterium RIFCSPHIGHO2_02_FULL_63_14]|nr:MAG: hypothetical protein A3D28_06415 [Omnitrophica bacterium RIFCSPHIGHO2_02_FULL_63_14]
MSERFASYLATSEEKAVGRNILYLLTERRETLEHLAKGVGVPYNTAYSWVASQLLPTTDEWPKLCDYLGITEDKLLNRRLPLQKKRPKARLR